MANKNSRRRYTRDFKLEAVQLARSQGSNVAEVARNPGITPNMLYRWIRELENDEQHAFPGLGKLKGPDEELLRLCKELADTKMERDSLKKALGIFSK